MSFGFVQAVNLRARGVLLEPMELQHEAGLQAAAADGEARSNPE
jgi:hypothetical protein